MEVSNCYFFQHLFFLFFFDGFKNAYNPIFKHLQELYSNYLKLSTKKQRNSRKAQRSNNTKVSFNSAEIFIVNESGFGFQLSITSEHVRYPNINKFEFQL